jgi:WD40 repeat protein
VVHEAEDAGPPDTQDGQVTQDLPADPDTQDAVATRDLGDRPAGGAPHKGPPAAKGPARAPLGRLGRFELLEVLGQGGFGTVYKAHDPTLERTVALKVPRVAGDPGRARDVLKEAKAAARLRHPNIVTVYETGQAGSTSYIATEFIDGVPLAVRLQRGVPPRKLAVRWVRDLARALAHAHTEGIVHRDVKPGNVMLDARNRPRLMDFGLARREGGGDDAGAAAGTPLYMAPEQARGDRQQIGPACDQYALGVILYELLTGRRPYDGPAAAVLARKRNARPFPLPRQLDRQIPPALEAICLKALAPEPARRYADLSALADDLQRWLDDEPVLARRGGPLERAGLWLRRHRLLAVAGGSAVVGLLVAAAALVAGFWGGRTAGPAAGLSSDGGPPGRDPLAEQRREQDRAECADLRRRAAGFFQQERYDRGVLLLARALERAEQVDEALADEVRLELAARDRQLFRLRLVLPVREELHGFGPDSTLAVTLAPDNEKQPFPEPKAFVRLWDLTTRRPLGKPVRRPEPNRVDDHYGDRAVAPGGRTLLNRLDDKTLQLIRAETGEPVGEPLRHDSWCLAWAFSPDGKRLLTAAGKAARLWDTETGRPVGDPWSFAEEVLLWDLSVAFSPDGSAVLVITSFPQGAGGQRPPDRLELRDAATGRTILAPASKGDGLADRPYAFSPDGRLVALNTGLRSVRLYDVHTGAPRGQPLNHDHWLQHFVFSPDGRTLLSQLQPESPAKAGETRTLLPRQVQIWDVSGGEAVVRVPAREYAGLLTPPTDMGYPLSPDGRTLVTKEGDQALRLWDAVAGKPIGSLIKPQGPRSRVHFSPDGRFLLVTSMPEPGSLDKIGRLYDTGTGEPVGQPLPDTGFVERIAFSPDGRFLSFQNSTFDTVDQVWELGLRKPVPLARNPDAFAAQIGRCTLGFGPDGKTVDVRDEEHRLFRWDAVTGQPIRVPPPPKPGWPYKSPIVASPDGTLALVEKGDTGVEVRDLVRGAVVGEPLRHDERVSGAVVSADNKVLATAAGRQARAWDAGTGKPLGPPVERGDRVAALALSPDGRLLATAGGNKDGEVWISEAATGKRLPVALKPDPTGFGLGANHLAFSPTGKFLVAGSFRRFGLWVAATGELFGPGPTSAPGRPSEPPVIESVTFGPGDRVVLLGGLPRETREWPARVFRLWDGTTGKPIGEALGPAVAQNHLVMGNLPEVATAFTPDGRAVLIAESKSGRLWDTATGKPLGLPLASDSIILAAALSPDGRRVLLRVANDELEVHPTPDLVRGDGAGLRLLTETITGQESIADGTFPMLSAATWQDRLRKLAPAAPPGGGP